ncbi:MAG: 4Fe-4S binding protein [Desulfobacterales bacterium]|nr:4Fe-4S binding protein [Desulfobacterales bacterium]
MSTYYIYQDQKRCIGCYACEVHRKSKGRAPGGAPLLPDHPGGAQDGEGDPEAAVRLHALLPLREAVVCVGLPDGGRCRRGAKDGIVFVDQHLCVGCKACVTACPWGVPQWDAGAGRVKKCDYCQDGVDGGLKPACVTRSAARALRWISASEASELESARGSQGKSRRIFRIRECSHAKTQERKERTNLSLATEVTENTENGCTVNSISRHRIGENNMVTIRLNGKDIQVDEGMTVLDAARRGRDRHSHPLLPRSPRSLWGLQALHRRG